MKFGSLFAGIGGFDLGLERAGMECLWQVEIDDYCNQVLEKHWPHVERHRDVREVGRHNLRPVDLIVGGFPCQPFSVAGKQKGKEDDRHLWPEYHRIIKELRPTWVIGENVAGLVNMGLDDVLSDLEAEGYATRTFNIPACGAGAYHQRQRLWIIAHANEQRKSTFAIDDRPGRGELGAADVAVSSTKRLQGPKLLGKQHDLGAQPSNKSRREIESGVGREAHGVSEWLDGTWENGIPRVTTKTENRAKRLKALGNAVVPHIPEILGRMIIEADRLD